MSETKKPPIVSHKHYDASSAFTPESLLREARRQKGLSPAAVPEICILDPDGDIVRHLRAAKRADRHAGWACYHTELYVFRSEKRQYGIVGHAVGAAFAVLVAEELFASGCRFLVSMTSAGQILPVQTPPYFIVIDRALRDEGTSYHYLPPSDYSEADARLTQLAREAMRRPGYRSGSAPPGRPMHRFGKPRQRSTQRCKPKFLRSRWRRLRSMPLRRRAADRCSASPTSPTRWGEWKETSKRARGTAPRNRSA